MKNVTATISGQDAPWVAAGLLARAEAERAGTWHVTCLGHEIEIRGRDELVEELREFFGVFYPLEPGAAGAAALTVSLVEREGPRAGVPERDMRRYVRSASPVAAGHGRSLFVRPVSDVLVVKDPDRRHVVVAASHPEELARQARVLIRDQLFGEIERAQGYVTFHSAAVGADGVVTMFVGRPGAGKTTSQLSLLASGRFGFVGSDRIKLRAADDGVEVQGVPSRSTVDPRALSTDPFLRTFADQLTDVAHSGKHVLDHRILQRWSGRPAVPRGRLGLVVSPKLAQRDQELAVERVTDPGRARKILGANLMDGTPDDTLVPWLGFYQRPDAAVTARALDRCLEAVARSVPVIEVRATYAEYREVLERRGLALFEAEAGRP